MVKTMSTRDKMIARKKKLESKGNGSGLVFPKEGVTRMRIKSPGEDKELGIEVIRFYIPGVGGVISPATFDEPCPFMEKYEELKKSKDDADKELAKRLVPSRRYIIGGIVYKDDKGKEVDFEGKDKGVLVSGSVYQDIIDLYLDEDEAGDMTDPLNGYDIKITRAGSGKFDTTYSVRACKPTRLDKKYRGTVDLEKIVRAHILPYDELKDKLNSYLNTDSDEEDEEDTPVKKHNHHQHSEHNHKKVHSRYKSDI